jgi:periplasmic protein TonB
MLPAMGEMVLARAEAVREVGPSAWAPPNRGLPLRGGPSPQKVALAVLAHVALLLGVIWLSHLLAKRPPEPGEMAVNLVFAPPAPGPEMPVAAVPSPREHMEPVVPTPLPAPAPPPREHVDTPAPPVAVPIPPAPTPGPLPSPPQKLTTEALPLPPVAPPPPRTVQRRVAARPMPPRAPANVTSAPPAAATTMATASAAGAVGAALVPARPVAGMESDRPPVYPESARRRGQQGRVILRVSVAPDGNPVQVQVGRSSGFTTLDDAALDAVRRWRFVPAMRAGQPVQAVAEVPVLFRLEE